MSKSLWSVNIVNYTKLGYSVMIVLHWWYLTFFVYIYEHIYAYIFKQISLKECYKSITILRILRPVRFSKVIFIFFCFYFLVISSFKLVYKIKYMKKMYISAKPDFDGHKNIKNPASCMYESMNLIFNS